MLETRLFARNQEGSGVGARFPGNLAVDPMFQRIYEAETQEDQVAALEDAVETCQSMSDRTDEYFDRYLPGLENLLEYVGTKNPETGKWRTTVVAIDCIVSSKLPDL